MLTRQYHLGQRHSEVPDKDDDWPTLGSILAFRDRVRARLLRLYDDVAAGRRTLNRHVARMLAMTLEHEGWHVEVRTTPPISSYATDVSRARPDVVVHACPARKHGDAPTPRLYATSLV